MKYKGWIGIVLLLVCWSSIFSVFASAEEYRTENDGRVRIRDGLSEEKAYKLAVMNICYKSVLDWLRSADNPLQRRNWEIIGGKALLFQEPEKYFTLIRILNKEMLGDEIYVKAEVGIDSSALGDLIIRNTARVAAEVNDAGLTLLFVARAADSTIDYKEDYVKKDSTEQGNFRVEKNIRKEKEFTSRMIDTTELSTSVTAKLNDTGLQFFNVEALLPYMEDSDRLEEYLQALETAFVGSVQKGYGAGSVEKAVAFVQREVKKLDPHPRYFALGQIDIGNILYNKEKKLYRGVARCSVTLWDMNKGFLPVTIVTTPLIDGIAEDAQSRRAQKAAAVQAAEKAGRMIIDRIYNSFLEEQYKNNPKKNSEFVYMLDSVDLAIDETVLYGGLSGDQEQLYAEATGLYKNDKYAEAFTIFMRLALTGYTPAMNMLGDMYRFGQGVAYNSQEAVEWYRKGAKQGNADAEYNLAICYHAGVGVVRDYAVGIEMLDKLAAEGYIKALNELAGIYQNGDGVEKDLQKAVALYQRASEMGSEAAEYNLALMYQYGVYFTQDYSRAAALLQKVLASGSDKVASMAAYHLGYLAEQGLGQEQSYARAIEYYHRAKNYDLEGDSDKGQKKALVRLAKFYILGLGVEKDYEKAFEFCKQAVISSDSEADLLMGQIYKFAYGVNCDNAEALRWFMASAEKGDPEGYFQIAVFYREGLGGEEKKKECLEWYRKAQEHGSAAACNDLGYMYQHGYYVEQDIEKAIGFYRMAAARKNADGAMNLALLYAQGEFVPQDYAESIVYLQQAIELGSVEAMSQLGNYYYNGTGVEQDYQKARKLLEEAAAGGSVYALENLGILYRDGIGVEQDGNRAIKLFEKAAVKGLSRAWDKLGMMFYAEDSPYYLPQRALGYFKKGAAAGSCLSMFFLGDIYSHGRGVAEDKRKAYEWYLKAAEAGDALSQYYIAEAYEEGRFGFELDYRKAVEWYKMAAAQGDEDAAKRAQALRYAY